MKGALSKTQDPIRKRYISDESLQKQTCQPKWLKHKHLGIPCQQIFFKYYTTLRLVPWFPGGWWVILSGFRCWDVPASVGRAQTWPAHRIAMSRKDPTFGFRESWNNSICVISGWGEAFVYTIYICIYYMDVFISLLVIPKPLLFGWEWWRSAGTWRLDLRQMGLGSRHFGRMEAQWLNVGLFFQWHANNANWRSSNICEQWRWGSTIHVR